MSEWLFITDRKRTVVRIRDCIIESIYVYFIDVISEKVYYYEQNDIRKTGWFEEGKDSKDSGKWYYLMPKKTSDYAECQMNHGNKAMNMDRPLLIEIDGKGYTFDSRELCQNPNAKKWAIF
ncbi:hypothetical protein COC69_17190 [Bacillus cereus]|uniref:Uncharacterized protein n=1 Tax=Bacillus cereus TaxID=1396 RepID=A0A9X7GVA8_BACCE|nr:hypothetical protein [Bacillus cereus]PGS78013.1 hypothetical protein COC69_17190 [Bacillus cereus]